MKTPALSVVIPVYNEERRIGVTLTETAATLRRRRVASELIVVDDGSTDDSVRLVRGLLRRFPKECRTRLIQHGINRGKGAAVRTGVMASRGARVVYMDADNSTPLSEADRFEEAFRQGAEVVLGSRAVDRSQIRVHQPFYRELMGRIFNLMVQAMALPGLWDTQCGFKAFTRRAADIIFPLQTIERFGFDVELLYIARRKGLAVREVQVAWSDAPGSRVRVVRDSSRMFADLLRIRLNDLKGRYSR